MLCLGEVGDTPFEIGETPQNKRSLWLVYLITTFTLLVHMVNMLVAIMSETFAKNREFSDQIILKSKLRFVIDNWSIKDDAFGKDRLKINYLVAALLNEDDDEEIEIIKDIQDDFKQLKYHTKGRAEDIKVQLKKLRNRV